MQFAVFCQPVVTIYDTDHKTKVTDAGLQSTISDEGLYGMVCRVLEIRPEATEESPSGWVRVMTHYGYEGWVCRQDVVLWGEMEMKSWQEKNRQGYLALVDTFCADIMSVPKVQGHCYLSLVGGGVVEVIPGADPQEPWGSETAGWSCVRLLNGQEGYVRTQHLCPKRYDEDLLWQDPEPVLARMVGASAKSRTAAGGQEGFALQAVLDQWFDGSEDAFREKLVNEAMKYMAVQYRWGGKSFRGIDCSGLVGISYMRCGILIYRDASIVDGYPMQRLPLEDVAAERLKKGDALYFPGHIAMYIGDGKYIHSTGKIGSGGVVINSLRPGDPDFRQDLLDCLYAAAGVRG